MNDFDAWAIAWGVFHAIVILLAAFVISANRKPSSAIAWLLIVIFLPVVGIGFYLLVGTAKLPKERRDKQQYVTDQLVARSRDSLLTGRSTTWPDWLPTLVTLNRNLGALPMVANNTVDLITDYDTMIKTIADEIDTATDYVHVEFFILVKDDTTQPFFDALARACSRGVTVRVLEDHLSQLTYPNKKETLEALQQMGAEFHPMLPITIAHPRRRPDLRNHRKLVVIDGRVGFTGSMNMIASHYHKKKSLKTGLHWHELMMRLEGPVVRELEAVFVTDWYSETEELLLKSEYPALPQLEPNRFDAQILPSGPSFANDNNLKLFGAAIQNARHRISVTSPYFVPDESIQTALVTAASRGIDVELFVSEISDQFMVFHAQRSYYEELLRAGVKIYLYRSPTVLHAKHLSIDDDVAIIGTSNMDVRSLSLHMELMVMIAGKDLVDELRLVEDDYRANSKPLTLGQWLQRPVRHKALDNVMRLTSALM
jgi:cardiolipin synthase